MAERLVPDEGGLQAWLMRMAALDLRMDAVEAWQARYEPIVDSLRDAQMIADAVAEKIADAHLNRWTKRHYLVAIAALFVPALVTSTCLVLIHIWIGA